VQVYEQKHAAANDTRRFLIIVHVKADYAFSRYFKLASQADMALFRGMFLSLKVKCKAGSTSARGGHIQDFSIQQAFLPKFENESQDTEIAAAIQAAADQRYMLVTVKHSGSLGTLSFELMGAKNSQGNVYTAVGVLLLHAHFHRVAAVSYALLPDNDSHKHPAASFIRPSHFPFPQLFLHKHSYNFLAYLSAPIPKYTP
jgi:hypothetical protein